jgi:hypothetical protein
MKNTKKRTHKTSDPTWDTQTYGNSSKSPFGIEWVKYYNKVEGRDQILFIYTNKDDGKIVKYRMLR